jgi:hypothetical protein
VGRSAVSSGKGGQARYGWLPLRLVLAGQVALYLVQAGAGLDPGLDVADQQRAVLGGQQPPVPAEGAVVATSALVIEQLPVAKASTLWNLAYKRRIRRGPGRLWPVRRPAPATRRRAP